MLDLIVRLGVQLHTFSAAKINGVCDTYFVNVNVYVIFIQNFEGQICERTLERHLIKRLGVWGCLSPFFIHFRVLVFQRFLLCTSDWMAYMWDRPIVRQVLIVCIPGPLSCWVHYGHYRKGSTIVYSDLRELISGGLYTVLERLTMIFLPWKTILLTATIVLFAFNGASGYNNFTDTNATNLKENTTEIQEDREFVFCKFCFSINAWRCHLQRRSRDLSINAFVAELKLVNCLFIFLTILYFRACSSTNWLVIAKNLTIISIICTTLTKCCFLSLV